MQISEAALNLLEQMEEESKPKLCRDCKHVATSSFGTWKDWKCFAPRNKLYDNLVDGKPEYREPSCEKQRHGEHPGRNGDYACGPEGRWYEFIERKPSFMSPTNDYFGDAKLPDYNPLASNALDINQIVARRKAEKASKKLSKNDLDNL